MNFVISTVLPVPEHGDISHIYSDLDLPVHVHKMDDMHSDFCPVLYDSMERSSSASLSLLRDHSLTADSIIAASQMRARLSFSSVLSSSTSSSSLQTTSSGESSDLPMYFRAQPRLPSVLEEGHETATLPKLPSYEIAVLVSGTNTALPV
uniref:Uncharacterized protein n=1 Tax=Steinernema glaseri TaxID=37863 RepID=A0A1I7YME9_9BILA